MHELGEARSTRVDWREALQLLGAAAGVGAYLLFLGGTIRWIQLSSAGLPADAIVATADPRQLVAAGARSLVRGPAIGLMIALAALLAAHLAETLKERDWPFARRIAKGALLGANVVAGLIFLYFGMLLSLAVLLSGFRIARELDGLPGSGLLWRVGVAALTIAAIALGARRRPTSTQAPHGEEEWPGASGLRAFAVARAVTAWWGRISGARSPRSDGFAWRVVRRGAIAVLVLEVTFSWSLVDSDLFATFVAVLLALPAGVIVAVWLARLSRWVEQLETTPEQPIPKDRIGGIVLLGVLAVVFVPLWLAVFVIGLALGVWIIDRIGVGEPRGAAAISGGLAPNFRLRLVVLVVVVSLSAICWETSPPISFDAAELWPDAGPPVTLAYLGTSSSATWFGFCDRDGVHSARVTAMGVPSDAVGVLSVRSGGYVFFPDRDPTVATALFALFGVSLPDMTVDPIRLALLSSPLDGTPVSEIAPAGVCGSEPAARDATVTRLRDLADG